MNCISCSSPVLLEMEDYFNSEEGIADSTTTVNTILDSLLRFMEGEYVQNRIDKVLYQAPYQCPHSPEYDQNFQGIEYEDLVPPKKDEDATGFLIAIIVVVICVVVLSTLAVIAARFITRRRHNRWLKQLNETQIQTLVKEEQYEAERQKDLNMRMSSLVRSPEVPLVFKIGIHITIFGNIALFLSGHLSLGGTVNISGSFSGQDFNIEGFFEFSMKTIQAATRAQEEEWGIMTLEPTNESGMLRKHSFMLDYEASSKRAVVKDWVSWLLLTVLVLLAVLVTLGCSLPSFSIEILGLLGLAVESGNEFNQAKTYYSVFSLAKLIMDEARYLGDTSSYVGLGTLASLLVLTVFIVPLGQTASLLIEWFMAINQNGAI
ncbi:hypothetical protein HJC23_006499 [Cyclotella cryptica]|uniref:Uncharacterized protein n=1 Tax=Cyclotella cryptica TaxID=29204 RepID=A0ABD3PT13_9STRA